MNPTDLTNLFSKAVPPFEESVSLTREALCDKLANIVLSSTENEDMNKELFISNYIYVSQIVISDLNEINEHLCKLKQADQTIPPEKDYEHRKIRYFAGINRRAKEEIVDFLCNRMIDYLLKDKNVDYVARQADELLSLALQSCYEYGFFKRYYDYNYDFSTEAKIRFIPGVGIENFLEKIKEFIELKQNDNTRYESVISSIINDNNILNYLYDKIESHNVMRKRLEVFETMQNLYATEKWQSFISLAILQIEGLFYDCCKVLNISETEKNEGTLVEKVDKSFKNNHILMLSVYPYYMFEIPTIRNEVAHTGLVSRDNLQHLANELILDLNTVISWIYEISHSKYTNIAMISDALDKCESQDLTKQSLKLLTEMLSISGVSDYKYLELLANPSHFTEEIHCMKTPDGYWEERINRIMGVVKTEEFWTTINSHIDEHEHFDANKPLSFLVLSDKLKNTFIAILDKDSPEKIACQEVAAKIQKTKQ